MVDRIYDAESGRGQLSERSVIVPTSCGVLDAIYLRGSANPSVLVIPSLSSGATMTSPLANEVAYSAAYQGHASLRFSWRGHGGSEGEFPEGDTQLAELGEDLLAATEHIRETVEVAGLCFVVMRDAADVFCEFAKMQLYPKDLAIFIQPPESLVEKLPNCRSFVIFPGEAPMNPIFREEKYGLHVSRIPQADKHWRRGLTGLGKRFTAILQTNL